VDAAVEASDKKAVSLDVHSSGCLRGFMTSSPDPAAGFDTVSTKARGDTLGGSSWKQPGVADMIAAFLLLRSLSMPSGQRWQ